MATVTFFSNYTEHVLVRRPHVESPIPGIMAGWQTMQTPIRYKFQPALNADGKLVGRLDVTEGQDKLQDHAGWLAAGQPSGVERDAADALRAHREFGRDLWELGHEPGTLYPRAQDLRKLITRASVALDEDALAEIIETELRSHNRRDLVSEAETALATVREAMVEMQAVQATQSVEPDANQPEPTNLPPTPYPGPKPAAKAKPKPKAAARA